MRQPWLTSVLVWVGICAYAAAAAAQGSKSTGPAAEVNGITITMSEVEEGAAQNLAKLEEQIYNIKRTRLDALIEDRLLASEAKKRGISTTALIEKEITAQVTAVSDADAAAFHESNKAKLEGDLTKWADQIKKYLTGQRVAARRQAFIKQLRESAEVKVFLEPPPVFRATVAVDGAPVRGAAAAPVTIVEFSDYHCPFCRRVQPVLQQLLERYDQEVRIVYKDLPIDSLHPEARAAAEAARCAGDQGRFWEFHDKLYASPADGSPAALRKVAQDIGLDAAKFESCRSARTYQLGVQTDVVEGASLGITGTPGFFINGRFLSGAQPIEAFSRIIDEELAAAAKKSGTAGAGVAGRDRRPLNSPEK